MLKPNYYIMPSLKVKKKERKKKDGVNNIITNIITMQRYSEICYNNVLSSLYYYFKSIKLK